MTGLHYTLDATSEKNLADEEGIEPVHGARRSISFRHSATGDLIIVLIFQCMYQNRLPYSLVNGIIRKVVNVRRRDVIFFIYASDIHTVLCSRLRCVRTIVSAQLG